MNHFKHAIALFALLFLIPVSAAAGISLKVSVVDGKLVKPYSGRVYVQIAPVTENGPVEPRLVGRWFNVPLIVAKDVSGWDGGAIALEDSALHYPSSVDDLAPGDYRAQAYVRLDKFSSNPGQGAADLVSAPVAFTHTEGADSDLALVIDRGVEVATPEDTDRVKFIEMRSDLLSDFHGFDYPVQAAVQLPKNWDPAKAAEYPVLYYVGGYGDDHIAELRAIQSFGELMDELVVVMPNGMNMRGHSVFADSDSIGPWGTALMTEMAPAIEAKFGLAGAAKRYVTGISSGAGQACGCKSSGRRSSSTPGHLSPTPLILPTSRVSTFIAMATVSTKPTMASVARLANLVKCACGMRISSGTSGCLAPGCKSIPLKRRSARARPMARPHCCSTAIPVWSTRWSPKRSSAMISVLCSRKTGKRWGRNWKAS